MYCPIYGSGTHMPMLCCISALVDKRLYLIEICWCFAAVNRQFTEFKALLTIKLKQCRRPAESLQGQSRYPYVAGHYETAVSRTHPLTSNAPRFTSRISDQQPWPQQRLCSVILFSAQSLMFLCDLSTHTTGADLQIEMNVRARFPLLSLPFFLPLLPSSCPCLPSSALSASWVKKLGEGAGSCNFPTDSCKFLTAELVFYKKLKTFTQIHWEFSYRIYCIEK